MPGVVPSLLLALFGAWCGTFSWGATAPGSGAAVAGLLGTLAWAGTSWRDPLRLGRTGRLLPLALWIGGAASAWSSPVPRAGWQAVVLLPAFLAFPAVVERCWRREAQRRWGLRLLAVTVAGIALWSLADWLALDSPRPAMPLGHHNLLAAWLVILLPVACLPAREAGRWRLAGLAAGVLAAIAILASRSLMGYAALALEAASVLAGRARSRRQRGAALLALMLVLALSQLPRVWRIVSGDDASARARSAYLAAGVEGFQARPVLGWGPGATAWTVPELLEPVLRVNPWGETVGDLHSLPAQLGYELGLTGILLTLGIVVLFFARRIAEREEGRDPVLLRAGLLGLAGGAVASLGSAALAVTALPLAAAVAAGAALAGGRRRRRQEPDSPAPVRVYALVALVALLPAGVAHWKYDQAVAADVAGRSAEAEAHLAEAIRADPSFPLYGMRLALLRDRHPGEAGAASGLALEAAEEGHAVPALWLVAGVLGYAEKRPWAPAALDRACALDPLAPLPPFYHLLADRTTPTDGAHAILAEPRLAAAGFWEGNPGLLARALEAVRVWPGVDAGWKEVLFAAVPPANGRRGPWARLALEIDTEAKASLSLPVFRRRPWPARWELVQVRQEALDRLTVPPAAASTGTSPSAFQEVPCRLRARTEHPLLTR